MSSSRKDARRRASAPAGPGRDPGLVLETDRLLLTLPPEEAAARVVAYYERNREHHGPWDPPRGPAFYTESYWRERLLGNRQSFAEDKALRLFLTRKDDPSERIIGSASFAPIERGPFLCCRLGYSLDRDATGRGLMTEALRRAIAYVFGPLGMHRIEANYVPTNEKSGAVLRRLGFDIQGYARDYLFISGEWRDHVLTALTNRERDLTP